MCGINGLLRLDGAPASVLDIRRMNTLLAHRGPDGEGTHVDGAMGLGHTRLAILDLSAAGHQPMSHADGRYWISYNGEIYNFIEIRAELERLGHGFRSETDTEVVLAAFAEWGSDCVSRFNGMWAFAIWDAAEHRLFLSRDRFGVKPLYYYADQGTFAFASEVKAFLGVDAIDLSFDADGLATSFALTSTMDGMELTPYCGVRRLLPGHNLSMREGDRSPRITRWWHTLDHLPEISPIPARQNERLSELLFDACRLRMRSDVPIGTCLSGGLDSSSVFGVINRIGTEAGNDARRARDWQSAFIARFPGSDNAEQEHAHAFARKAGATIRVLDVRPEDAIGVIGDITYDFEETGLLYPAQWLLYRELRRAGTLVSLDGHGADECLAGYTTNATHMALDLTGRLMTTARAINDAKANPDAWGDMVRRGTMPDVPARIHPPSFDPRSLNYTVLDYRALRGTPQPYNAPVWEEDAPSTQSMDLSFQLLYNQGHGGFLQWVLRTYDMASMAHGVESRAPFLDWRLFCFCLALPSTRKVADGYTKLPLRRAMAGLVPDGILDNKRKTGFPTPLFGWLDGPLRPVVDDCVRSLPFATSPLWDGGALAAAVRDGDGANEGARYRLAWPYVQTYLLAERFKQARRRVFDATNAPFPTGPTPNVRP